MEIVSIRPATDWIPEFSAKFDSNGQFGGGIQQIRAGQTNRLIDCYPEKNVNMTQVRVLGSSIS